jgi:hypothetical protein
MATPMCDPGPPRLYFEGSLAKVVLGRLAAGALMELKNSGPRIFKEAVCDRPISNRCLCCHPTQYVYDNGVPIKE